MPTQQEVMDKLSQVGTSANDLMMYFQGAKVDINQTLSDAQAGTNVAIANVKAAIPTAVSDELYQILDLDAAGDDSTATGASNAPFKTLKALIDSTPASAVIMVRVKGSKIIDIDDDIHMTNKSFYLYSTGCTFNFNASIYLHKSNFANHYPDLIINQNCASAFVASASSVNLRATVNPSSDAVSLIKAYAPYGYVRGILNDTFLQGEVTDAAETYNIIVGSVFISAFGTMTLGLNVALYDASLSVVQCGTKKTYFIG